jgi:hypothetical protein
MINLFPVAAVIPVEIPMERVRRTLCTARKLALDWLCPDVHVSFLEHECVSSCFVHFCNIGTLYML